MPRKWGHADPAPAVQRTDTSASRQSHAGSRVLAFSATSFTVEATGTSSDIEQFIELLRPLGIRDLVRSAPIALSRAGAEGETQPSEPASAAQ